MKRIFVITGAAGHLGSTLIRMLDKSDIEIRGLIVHGEEPADWANVTYIEGDVRDKNSLRKLFEGTQGAEVYVLHTAGIVDISDELTELLYDVNVTGTQNVTELCMEYGVKRLLYVSSVHAIPESADDMVMEEVQDFAADNVVGAYAKTKAAATQIVLDAVKNGLDGVVVHPSGILGPYDKAGNHMVQMVRDYIRGKLPACVTGGYDFVDVRDVADGCLRAVEKGGSGECYILSNRHYSVKEILRIVRRAGGGRKLPTVPMWMAQAVLPFIKTDAKLWKKRPLYTKYSLYTLSCNDKFSHNKATRELGYAPRDLVYTVRDTVEWLGMKAKKKKVRA